jgi:ring-1,2-phenylacetyl-CoA epoxidase subunit PaaD
MLTLSDLGVLRDVRLDDGGTVVVEITPTYTGCPAMGTMRADLVHALHEAGFADVDVRTVLAPAWSTDWITPDGRRKLAEAGIAPPGPAPDRPPGPVPLQLGPSPRSAPCPLCGSEDTEQLSEFSATACKALRRCRSCREPFEHVKEI